MSFKTLAELTLKILEQGSYQTPTGKIVSFDLTPAVAGTRLYTPQQAKALLELEQSKTSSTNNTQITVTSEKTQAAAKRLVQDEGLDNLVLLNFASARNPGGGFIGGARAQEEDLCRCSGLYSCLMPQTAYYAANRAQDSLLYTDHLIYSPQVPWFRQDNNDLLEQAYYASVITAPAPNAGQVLLKNQASVQAIYQTLHYRAGLVLAIAKAHQHENLLLGAWGCGVFKNDPQQVAQAFADWLAQPQFKTCFKKICFAVYTVGKNNANLLAFQRQFIA
ncbi:TIGR02452 family protein [uncultured Thiothrix sp.]|uniref:TIGR02452 family protein n=1 Tax=uncultured Thiothrix sp. TaxID=223185 RepID=UPI00262952E7|nr:TIGR02452 family protein [uncultured Thiothrix sp.]